MDLLQSYGDAEEQIETNNDSKTQSSSQSTVVPGKSLALALNPAPEVELSYNQYSFVDPTSKELKHNPKYDELFAPVQGAVHPFRKEQVCVGGKNHIRGWVEEEAINPLLFHEQFHTFHSFGYAVDPSHGATGQNYVLVGDVEAAQKLNGATIFEADKRKRRKISSQTENETNEEKVAESNENDNLLNCVREVKKACLDGEFATETPFLTAIVPLIKNLLNAEPPSEVQKMLVEDFGWDEKEEKFTLSSIDRVLLDHQLKSLIDDPLDEEDKKKGKGKKKRFEDAADMKNWKGPWAKADVQVAGLSEEQRKQLEEETADYNDKMGIKPKTKSNEAIESSTTFHGDSMFDYQGRTYLYPPSELKPKEQKCFLPKKQIHEWDGHEKGVHAIRLFPKYGHILLSAGMDGKVKLWDVYNDRKLLRTFMGHSAAVRDICWNHDGSKFLSASYDRYIRLWDTETGKVLGTYTNHRTPYVAKFHPDADKEHEFIVGCSNNKIVQWDTRTSQIVQEYDQHLGAVNTLTFIDEGRRFVSTSDDKSIRVWEWGIPVVIKYLCEPHMHTITSVAVHPNGNWAACQSMDNQILIYSTKDRFKLNRKKHFIGHTIAGYSCQVNYSADGSYVMSGDGEGKLWIWDFKTSKVLKTIRAHKGVCVGCEWHPVEPSRVVTCGWDGKIRYWD